MNRKVVLGDEAREKLKEGINILADVVGATLGAKGRNVAYTNALGMDEVTKDGVSVAREVRLEDRGAQMGVNMMRQAAERSGSAAGDGTTTATVLARALVNGALKMIAADANPQDIKRGIDKAVAAVVAYLNESAIPVQDVDTVTNVAIISANNDEYIGTLIGDAYRTIGFNGIVTAEESNGQHTYMDLANGMKLETGYANEYFVTDMRKEEGIVENAAVLIYDGKIGSMTDLVPVLEPLLHEKQPVYIIASAYEGEVLASLSVNALRGNMKLLVSKAPHYGIFQKDILSDLAVFTGATVISDSAGIALKDVQPEHLGFAKKIISTKKETVVVEGGFSEEGMVERIEMLRHRIEEAELPAVKEELHERIAKLKGGVATLYVGASTPVELKEKRDRIDDAIYATRAAIEEGIVPGGGIALLKAKSALKRLRTSNQDEAAGVNIVIEALEAPIRKIVENAGYESSVIVNKVQSSKNGLGFDVKADKYTNMVDVGIIDAKKVTRVALESAASVAGMILITECILVNLPEKNEYTE